MLDFVPLACARRKVADSNRQTGSVRERLDLPFPQPNARTVASTAVRRDEERPRSRVDGRTHFLPPPVNRVGREARSVMIHPDRHPTGVSREVVHPVGDGFPLFGDQEVVDPNRLGIPFGTPGSPSILEASDELFLLRIHGDHRLPLGLESTNLVVDVAELRIAVGVVGSLAHLPICLETVARMREKVRHELAAD